MFTCNVNEFKRVLIFFQTWLLEAFREGALIYFEHRAGYPRSVAWRFGKRFVRQHIENFLDTNVSSYKLCTVV